MTTINVYLTFDGNCEEAFNFYKTVFGGKFSYIGKFRDIPPSEDVQSIPEEFLDRIMHVGLPISKETVLMGSDTIGGPPFVKGNNFSISINTDSKENADNYFKKLSEGGNITMPMNDTFWGDYFGACEDKFSINWMISFNEKQQQ